MINNILEKEHYCLCENNWNNLCPTTICSLKKERGQLRYIQEIQNKYNVKLMEKLPKCSYESCPNKPIISHTISKSQLSKVCDSNSQVYITNASFLNLIDYKRILRFEKKGINIALTFSGFCHIHDNQLFKYKNVDIDLANYKPENENAIITLLYRTVARQVKLIEVNKEVFKEIKNNIGFKLFCKNIQLEDNQDDILEALLRYKNSFLNQNEKILNQMINSSLKRINNISIYNSLLNLRSKSQLYKRIIQLEIPISFIGFAKANFFKLNIGKNFIIVNSYVQNNKWTFGVYCLRNDKNNVNKLQQLKEEDIPYFVFWHLLVSGLIVLSPTLINSQDLQIIDDYMNNQFINENNEESDIGKKIEEIKKIIAIN